MLDYAVKLNRAPWTMTKRDVVRLRRAGFADADIHDIAAITGHFAFVNRLADGLGVELEPYWKRR
jgi:alkylhydroperoxidase family enzyme